jgi:hypothetical protein
MPLRPAVNILMGIALPIAVVAGAANIALAQPVLSDSASSFMVLYTFPDFLHVPKLKPTDTLHVADTQYYNVFYDRRDSITTRLAPFDSVFYITRFKTWTDYTHFYTDAEGKKQHLPIVRTAHRFDRTGKQHWLYIDYAANKMKDIEEQPEKIAIRDTFYGNSVAQHAIIQYYATDTK